LAIPNRSFTSGSSGDHVPWRHCRAELVGEGAGPHQLRRHSATRLACRLIAVFALLLVALLSAAPASAAKPCWRQILDDWTDNTRLNKTYPIECYDAALKNLPEDIVSYTDAFDTISNARQDALQGERVPSAFEGDGGDDDPDAGGGGSGGPLGDLLGAGTDSADSIPLPLLILGALAALLMAAGAAGLISRKLQARRAAGPEPPE
jgi:hypothetical protein